MSYYEKKKYIYFNFFLIIFLLLTNKFYNFEQTILINQLDGLSYMSIANSSPYFTDELIPYHHSQRFFIPFSIGLIGNYFQIDNYFIFRFLIFLIILAIFIMHAKITFNSKCNYKTAIMCVSIVFLNPYLFRYFFAVPTMINDAIFLMSLYFFAYGIFKNNYFVYLAIIISILSRQTGLFVLLASLYFYYENKSFKSIFFISIYFISILLVSNFYAKNTSIGGFNFEHLTGFLHSFIVEKNFMEILKWILLPIYSFLPLILFSYLRKGFLNLNLNSKKIMLIFISLSTILITILAGPELASRNILRQTSIILPIFVIYLMYFSVEKNERKSFFVSEYIILIIFFISSLHPIYSKIKILNLIKIV